MLFRSPLNWKGWTLFGSYIGAILAVPQGMTLAFGYEGSSLQRLAAVLLLSVPFLMVMWKKTEGGWRWRNGDDGDAP